MIDVLSAFVRMADNIHEQMGEFQWKLTKNQIGNARKENLSQRMLLKDS